MTDQLDLEDEVRDLFKRKLGEFAQFCAEDWLLSKDDHEFAYRGKGEAHREGYNAAMKEGVERAVDCWAEPLGYT